MRRLYISIMAIVGIVVVAATSAGVFIEKMGENQQQPYTSIMINGVKENYTVDEPISFSVTLEGYGIGCGDTKAAITKENDTYFQPLEWANEPQCVPDANLHNFKFNPISVNTKLNQTGNYVLKVSFNDSTTYRHAENVAEFSVISPSATTISSKVFPTLTMLSFDGVSVKGNLSGKDGTGLPNKEILFYLDNATLDNGTAIPENLLMGKTTTDTKGCFYFTDWDENKSLQFRNSVFRPHVSGSGLGGFSDNVHVYINTVFAGTKNLSGSSNVTRIMYEPIVPPIEREAVNALLVNGTTLDFVNGSSVELERGKSYNFKVYVTWGDVVNLKTIKAEIKNLPCEVNATTEELSDLTNKTQAILPVTMTVDRTAPAGNFSTYVSINDYPLEPLNLVIR